MTDILLRIIDSSFADAIVLILYLFWNSNKGPKGRPVPHPSNAPHTLPTPSASQPQSQLQGWTYFYPNENLEQIVLIILDKLEEASNSKILKVID
jgi:hypothetical protein